MGSGQTRRYRKWGAFWLVDLLCLPMLILIGQRGTWTTTRNVWESAPPASSTAAHAGPSPPAFSHTIQSEPGTQSRVIFPSFRYIYLNRHSTSHFLSSHHRTSSQTEHQIVSSQTPLPPFPLFPLPRHAPKCFANSPPLLARLRPSALSRPAPLPPAPSAWPRATPAPPRRQGRRMFFPQRKRETSRVVVIDADQTVMPSNAASAPTRTSPSASARRRSCSR